MNLLLNFLFGLIAAGIALWVCQGLSLPLWTSRAIAVLVGILVFLADFAARLHSA